MKSKSIAHALTLWTICLLPVAACAASGPFPEPPKSSAPSSPGRETAVFAGGCFWGIEGVFERVEGVVDVVSGYSGGSKETAEYELVGTGKTGHAESVRIVFDPQVVSYGTLLQVFFSVAHDPTELNFQGPDVGPQYRSAVFWTDDRQKKIATEYVRSIDSSGYFSSPIVTQIVAFEAFYPAEDYHQDFMKKHSTHGYIVRWDGPKIAHLERAYPHLLKKKQGA